MTYNTHKQILIILRIKPIIDTMNLGHKKADRGFTLIELLVVIAIIGILSSVVLASLNTARNRGADAAVKSNLANARAEAELYYDTQASPTYVGVCATTGSNTIGDNIAAAGIAGGGATDCNDAAGAWAASSVLKTSGFWCVDSTGASKTATANLTTQTACP